jgi:hypothetical protein
VLSPKLNAYLKSIGRTPNTKNQTPNTKHLAQKPRVTEPGNSGRPLRGRPWGHRPLLICGSPHCSYNDPGYVIPGEERYESRDHLDRE